MKRTKHISSNQKIRSPLAVQQQVISEFLSRSNLADQLGFGYGDKRKLYKALGYPEDRDLDFDYFYKKYDRQDIARAIIDRPCDATWRGDVAITEPGKSAADSDLNKKWKELDELLGLKKRLNKVDKLCELGRFSILLLGLDDVNKLTEFKNAVSGARKLLYVKQFSEGQVTIETWDKNPQSPRYGMPVLYSITSAGIDYTETSQDLLIHHSRVMHYVTGNLTSEVYGVSKLKPVINRLIDLEKLLGGDAEMFWRGARPGYTASAKDDYELSQEENAALQDELDKYEHDLRRFIVSKGIDIEALEQQIADPTGHIDVQLQAISAQTGIPKRVLIGSERGELASSQDQDQWKELVKTRQEEHAETTIVRPFVDKLMEYKILPLVKAYNIVWDDVFAPSEKDKTNVGKTRAEALSAYANSAMASTILPPEIALKLFLGLNEEQVQEAIKAMKEQLQEERRLLEQEDTDAEELVDIRPQNGQPSNGLPKNGQSKNGTKSKLK